MWTLSLRSNSSSSIVCSSLMKDESFFPLINEHRKQEKLVTKPIMICMNCPAKHKGMIEKKLEHDFISA